MRNSRPANPPAFSQLAVCLPRYADPNYSLKSAPKLRYPEEERRGLAAILSTAAFFSWTEILGIEGQLGERLLCGFGDCELPCGDSPLHKRGLPVPSQTVSCDACLWNRFQERITEGHFLGLAFNDSKRNQFKRSVNVNSKRESRQHTPFSNLPSSPKQAAQI